jgi:hypothetical protein
MIILAASLNLIKLAVLVIDAHCFYMYDALHVTGTEYSLQRSELEPRDKAIIKLILKSHAGRLAWPYSYEDNIIIKQ